MPTNTRNVFQSATEIKGTSAPLLHEVLTKVNNAKDKPKKIEVLKSNDSVPLRQILKGAFDPKIIWELPEGTPPYKENDAPADILLGKWVNRSYDIMKVCPFMKLTQPILHSWKPVTFNSK